MTPSDIRFVILVFLLVLLGIALFLDPFNTVSLTNRSIGGLILGPMALLYAGIGIKRGVFTEMSNANLIDSPLRFWFCATSFLMLGVGASTIGVFAMIADH